MKPVIHIGNIQGKEAIDAVADAIIRIMGADAEQKTIRAALSAFKEMAEIKNISLSDMTAIGEEHNHYASADQSPGDSKENEAQEPRHQPWHLSRPAHRSPLWFRLGKSPNLKHGYVRRWSIDDIGRSHGNMAHGDG